MKFSDRKIILHPFKEGVYGILESHFAPPITKNFILEFEANMYNMDNNKNIQNQRREEKYVLEVRYKTGDDTSEYICDVYSWESKAMTEYRLLKFITDKVRDGKIGSDWSLDGKGVSTDVKSGKYETKD